MVQMRVGQQDVVDAGGIKAKRTGIFLIKLTTALIQPAVDQNSLPGAFDQMTGSGDAAIGSMEGYFQLTLPNICQAEPAPGRRDLSSGRLQRLSARMMPMQDTVPYFIRRLGEPE